MDLHTGISAGAKTPFVDILLTDETFHVTNAPKLMRGIPMKFFYPKKEG